MDRVISINGRKTLRRRVGEGSFVGVRGCRSKEEIVEWFRHLYAYRYALNIAKRGGFRYLLDVGCGTGYGVNELSMIGIAVGVDIWREGIAYAHETYGRGSHFVLASALNLPFRDDIFDLAVSFQVLEHIEPSLVDQYLKEARRVLKGGGTSIVTTPNRRLRLLPLQRPWNPDHKREYDAKEFKALINRVFEDFKITGLFARKNVYYVEYRRVRQNPWLIYILKPTTSILKTVVPRRIISMVKVFFEKKKVARKYDERFNVSLEDFKLSERELNSCIDLYAICIKKTYPNKNEK